MWAAQRDEAILSWYMSRVAHKDSNRRIASEIDFVNTPAGSALQHDMNSLARSLDVVLSNWID
jgi:hypothetical protein